MKHGCMVMTLRLSSSRRNGSCQIHHGRKKRVKFAALSSPWWSFFFDIQGTVHNEFVPPGQTINGKFYCEVLIRLREGIWRKRPARQVEEKQQVSPPWQPAHSHITRSTIPDFQKHYSDSPPPHSPDLAPCDFFLFPKMKLQLKGHRFDTTEEIHAEMQEVIDTHLRTSRDAWNHGKHVGIAVYMPNGTTLKETVETTSYGKKLFFMVKFPEFLGSPTYITSSIYHITQFSQHHERDVMHSVQPSSTHDEFFHVII